MPDFSTLLSTPVDDAKRPEPLPAGTYNGTIFGQPEFGESKQKKTPYVRFHLRVTSPGDDVDPSTLQGIDLSKKKLSRDFYFTDESKYRLKDFLQSCGIDTAGRSWDQTIPEAVGQEVLIGLTLRPDPEDPMIQYNEVKNLKGTANA